MRTSRSMFFRTGVGRLGSIILLAVLIPACAVFRSAGKTETDSISVRQEEHQIRTAYNTEGQRALKFFYADSALSGVELTIIPEGEFVYSPVAGFKGKARRLSVSSKQQRWSGNAGISFERSTQQIDSLADSATESKERVRLKKGSSLVNRTSSWAAEILLGILILRFIIWKRACR